MAGRSTRIPAFGREGAARACTAELRPAAARRPRCCSRWSCRGTRSRSCDRAARPEIGRTSPRFGVFSFVEAAVLLVAAGVLYLVWARSQHKAFHLPGGDGTVIMAAGGWALLLLVWRLFDKPDVDDPGATVGIQWGMFAALLAAGAADRGGRAGARGAPARAAEPGGRRRRLGAPGARDRAAAGARPPAGADRRHATRCAAAGLGGRAARGARARTDVGPAGRARGAAGARPQRARPRRATSARADRLSLTGTDAARRARSRATVLSPSRRAPAAAAAWR